MHNLLENVLSYKPEYNIYNYIIKRPIFLRLLFVYGIIAWIFVMYGYIQFLQLNVWYWVLFGPIFLLLSLYYLTSFGINLFYKKFDLVKHNRLKALYYNNNNNLPSVDIFLPVCGEDIWVITQTFHAVSDINYPNKKVYVLDDKGDNLVKNLARDLGFIYLSRPDKGYMKKAGNLKYGFDHSYGEYIVVFDADFKPHPEFIRELLPYMADPFVGLVQSPQYFRTDDDIHKRSIIEFGVGHSQEDFYRIVQVARDSFGGAICVGSNAMYRRSALASVGGTAQTEHSEDVHTGFNLINNGYSVKYIPLILAIGLCPNNPQAVFNQQHRWCYGSLYLLLKSNLLNSKLSFAQKICYINGVLYYLVQALGIAVSVQLFVLLLFHRETITLENALPFIPFILFTFVILPLYRITKPKLGTFVAPIIFSFSYLVAISSHVFKKPSKWTPTNSKKLSTSGRYRVLLSAIFLYYMLYTMAAGLMLMLELLPVTDPDMISILFWMIYNIALNSILIVYCLKEISLFNSLSLPVIRRTAFRFAGVYAAGLLIAFLGFYNMNKINDLSHNIFQLSRANSIDSVQTELHEVSEVDESITQVEKTDYIITATIGDSASTISRKAVLKFVQENNLIISNYQVLYMEIKLTETVNTNIRTGEKYIFTHTELDELYRESGKLSEKEKRSMSRMASRIDFEKYTN